jgi:flagellum-specific ATP synthase
MMSQPENSSAALVYSADYSLEVYIKSMRTLTFGKKIGWVQKVNGLIIEANGPNAMIGEMCRIYHKRNNLQSTGSADEKSVSSELFSNSDGVLAEVVGVNKAGILLMPYGSLNGIGANSLVVSQGEHSKIGVGSELIGRVIDGFGKALDGRSDPLTDQQKSLMGTPLNPMLRPRISDILETGIRSIDCLLTLGRGQRVGIFSGSGVGKSTLLGMITRHIKADLNVIALIGERGREVKEFVEKQLGEDGLQRSIVVVATSDQPALSRIRAANAAVSIAEHFRDLGQHVVLTMDSITRLAMARREVGLSAGEPPTARGYTPSVFAELPQICERCGTSDSGGSITALMTVLVEGDDMNEPISDSLRAILDGHIVLSRSLAQNGQYPAIDVLQSASRLITDLSSPDETRQVAEVIKMMSLIDRNRAMVEIGAYEKGVNLDLDFALERGESLFQWLSQSNAGESRADAFIKLKSIMLKM